MPDREKVISEFEDFVKSFSKRDDTYYKGLFISVLSLLKDQEAEIENLKQTCQSMMEGAYLLKEQDAVEPSFKQDEKGIFVWCCGSCGTYMYHIYDGIDKAKEYAKFCRQCGRAVKWQ